MQKLHLDIYTNVISLVKRNLFQSFIGFRPR
ncbi:unnamed protein product, partial [marine sediment metagenome]